MTTVKHRINERVVLVRNRNLGDVKLRIYRVKDGYIFNKISSEFEPFNSGSVQNYDIPFDGESEGNSTVADHKVLTLLTLSDRAQDLLFAYLNEEDEQVEVERHIFGTSGVVNEPSICTVQGFLKNVSGEPLIGQKVEAYLNRAGYFTHKSGLVGYAASAITDDTGYFELPLMVGLDVTISIPVIGFTTRGIVPSTASVVLSSHALLSAQP